jgi:hypothetical protein
MSKPTIVIGQPWGGLGDNLQFSTLPQLYSEQGYDVYISNQNAIRNQEIYDLIWGMNPYIKGTLNSPPTAGACKGFHRHTDNPMKNMELMHGLSNGTQKYPIIYYKPKLISDLSNCLLFDTTSIAQKYRNKRIISDEFANVFSKYPHLDKKRVVFKHLPNRDDPPFDTDTIEVNSIYEYCDMIYSCNVFLCLLSGQSALASAIKQDNPTPIIHSVLPSSNHYPRGLMYVFDNIQFINPPYPPE